MTRLAFAEHAATFTAGIVLGTLTPDRGLIVAGVAAGVTWVTGRVVAGDVFGGDEWDALAKTERRTR